ncbi:hypothetical protein NDN08_005603 [Rhodosorus marinus]|uniref:Uncharacterized protein n=1 Tax=Rhodosorus marinus TaxID=101924 RepID=A0AAV8V226_9RHOD|nr:hypothetical protein NDN08_005603 [Rhodosorus marinus]
MKAGWNWEHIFPFQSRPVSVMFFVTFVMVMTAIPKYKRGLQNSEMTPQEFEEQTYINRYRVHQQPLRTIELRPDVEMTEEDKDAERFERLFPSTRR